MKLRDRSAIMSRKEESSQKSMKTTKPDQNQWVIIAPGQFVCMRLRVHKINSVFYFFVHDQIHVIN